MSFKQTIRSKLPAALGTYHFLLAWTAAKLHRKPSGKIFVIGVTGTKGKTTTLELINAILEAAGKKTALLSSLRVKVGGNSRKNPTGNSMPGRGYIQNFFRQAVKAQCGYALVEVTSQGVVAHRHRFIDWNLGVLTNLHPEHIESHGSFENYRAAKLDFLKYVLARNGKVFLNEDDPNFPFFNNALTEAKTVPYSVTGSSLARYLPPRSAGDDDLLPNAAKFLLSDFNKSNIACAVAIAKELGIDDVRIEKAIAGFEGVPGRMSIAKLDGYTAVVDYAHTPDSLEAAYKAVKPKKAESGERRAERNPRLICILGACGGGRDVWKRAEFGKIAATYCDEIFLTEEDPYDENPKTIIEGIKSGFSAAAKPTLMNHVHEIPSRRDAIAQAVAMMDAGDVVIGTGKGSEDWIHYARGKKTPWNEKHEFEQALLAKKDGTLIAGIQASATQSGDGLELPWM